MKRRPKFGLLSRADLRWTWTSQPSSAVLALAFLLLSATWLLARSSGMVQKAVFFSQGTHLQYQHHNITNEILFEGRRGHSEKQKICVDGEGELGLGLDSKGEIFDSRDGMYWVVWSGSCRGSSEDGCARFGRVVREDVKL